MTCVFNIVQEGFSVGQGMGCRLAFMLCEGFVIGRCCVRDLRALESSACIVLLCAAY